MLAQDTNTLPALELSGWDWSGTSESLAVDDAHLYLIGGETGELLTPRASFAQLDDWLFLKARWESVSSEDAMVLRWQGMEVVLLPTEQGWVPALGDVLFNDNLAIPYDQEFEIALRIDPQGGVDFAWNGDLLLEGSSIAFPEEESLHLTVPPGFVLELDELRWTPVNFETIDTGASPAKAHGRYAETGGVKPLRESPRGSRSPGGSGLGLPPPHPFLAMDSDRHLLRRDGTVFKGGHIHAGGALAGSGRAADQSKSNN